MLAVILPFQRAIVTRFRHHQLVADITGTGIEDELFLQRIIDSSKYQSTGSWETAGAKRDSFATSDIPRLQRVKKQDFTPPRI
jgi:hypothetical protein